MLQIKIRFWFNGVCCSWDISFRWHFWHIHFLSNNVILKNKVLSYHGLNSGKSSTEADYLHFPSNENTNVIFLWFLVARNIYSTVYHSLQKFSERDSIWDCKIVKIEYYLADCTDNLYHHHLCACAKPFWVVLKICLDSEKFFSPKWPFRHTHYFHEIPQIPWHWAK